MRFALAGAVAIFDVFAGAAMFSGSPSGLPWLKMMTVALAAFAVVSGGILLGECFASTRGYPSPFGAAPASWLKTHFILAGVLIVVGVLIAGMAGRRALIPIAGAGFLMLLSDGVLQRTDVLEGLMLSLTRGLSIAAGMLIYPEAVYRLNDLSFYELPVIVASAVFMVSLLGRALEPEPHEARTAGVLAAICLLAVIALAGWVGRQSLWAAAIWTGVFILALEQTIVLWPASIAKRRRIVRNLVLSLPLGMEAAAIAGLGRPWVMVSLLTAGLAIAYFLVVSIESEPVGGTSTFARRRR